MALDYLQDAPQFDQDDNAEFKGLSDLSAYWYSMQPTTDGETLSGFFIPTGRQAFDEAVEALNGLSQSRNQPEIRRVTAIHDSTNDNGVNNGSQSNEKEYWVFPGLNLFILAKGLKQPYDEQGIVYKWITVDYRKITLDKSSGKPKPNLSILRFRAIIAEFIEVGYGEPIQINVSSTKAGYMLKCLEAQKKVLQAHRDLIGKKDAIVPYWAYSLRIQKMLRPTPVGGEVKKNMVMPEVVLPESLGESYLSPRWFAKTPMGTALQDHIKTLLTETIQWAQESVESLSKKQEQSQEQRPQRKQASDFESDADYMNASDEDLYEEAPKDSNSNGATDGQRKALAAISKSKNRPDLLALSNDKALSFEEASKTIEQANKKK